MNYTFMILLILLVDLNQGKLYYKLERFKFEVNGSTDYLINGPFNTNNYKECLRSCDNSFYCKVVTFKQGKCTQYKGGTRKKSTADDQTEIYVQQLPCNLFFN